MITYVNTVLVSNNAGATTEVLSDPKSLQFDTAAEVQAKKGLFVVESLDDAEVDSITANTDKIRIGMYTGSYTTTLLPNGNKKYIANIKWSNAINKNDIKSVHVLNCPEANKVDTEDTVTIDFAKMTEVAKNTLALGGKIVVLRLTFKDLPTRFRNWTESYDYLTQAGDDAAKLASAFAHIINKAAKRARVEAVANNTKLVLTAMKYDDDNSSETINWANKVRFNANMYWQDPAATGFASSNKYMLGEETEGSKFIAKEPGKQYAAAAKLVRDRESQALGYDGILNRGNGTWPIIKPAIETDINALYDGLTIEFENMYRAADDIFRKTKQTVEIYAPKGRITNVINGFKAFIGTPETNLNDTKEGVAFKEPVAAA